MERLEIGMVILVCFDQLSFGVCRYRVIGAKQAGISGFGAILEREDPGEEPTFLLAGIQVNGRSIFEIEGWPKPVYVSTLLDTDWREREVLEPSDWQWLDRGSLELAAE